MKNKPRVGTELTAWEKQVLRLVCQGYSNTEIAEMTGHTKSSIAITIWRVRIRLGIERDLRLALLRNYWERGKSGNQG